MASVHIHSMDDLPRTGTEVQQVTHDYVVSWPCLEESVSYAEHSISVPEYNNLDYTLASNIITYGGSITPFYPSTSLAMPVYAWHCMPQLQPASIRSEQLVQSSLSTKKPRRTLSDDKRRQICSYYEEHRATHAAIGKMFDVDRTTISKILSRREEYLSPRRENKGLPRTTKRRAPSIRKTVLNWMRKRQRQGFQVSDAMIEEKAHFLATICGCRELQERAKLTCWISELRQEAEAPDTKLPELKDCPQSKCESSNCLIADSVIVSYDRNSFDSPVDSNEGVLDLPCPLQDYKPYGMDYQPRTAEEHRGLLENQNNRRLHTGLNKPILELASDDTSISATQFKEGFMQKEGATSIKRGVTSPIISGCLTQSDAQRALDIVMCYYRDHPDQITLYEYRAIDRMMGHLEADKFEHGAVFNS